MSRREQLLPMLPLAHWNAMEDTPASLLERLKQTNDPQEWDRFIRLFTPLLWVWARKLGIQDADAEDLVQDVMLSVLDQLAHFTYDPSRSFRAWLRTVLVNRWNDWQSKNKRILLSPEAANNAVRLASVELEEAEYHRHLISRGLASIEAEFAPICWEAFRAYVLEEASPHEVAEKLHISTNLVYLAKSRILARLRQELEGLLDSS